MFQKTFFKYSHNVAFVSDLGEKMSYKDIQGFSDRIKKVINKRSFVFCLCDNTAGSLCGYVSFIDNGVVPLLLNASIDIELLDYLIQLYEPNYVWLKDTLSESYPNYKTIFSELGYSLVQISKKEVALDNQLALLLTTSGSTGSPKLVRLSYTNIQANAESIAEYLNISENDRPITALPMSYTYGLSVINSHLIKGATLLLTDKSIAQKEFWTFFRIQKATSMAGVPYSYEMLKRLRFFSMDLPDLKTLTQAGGKLSPELVKEFVEDAKKKGRKFFVMYGQTEATARMSYLPFEKAKEKFKSVGIAIPGGDFTLINEQGHIIESFDTDGELIYSGKNVSMGYAECREDLAKSDENGGVLHTGDIARRDSDGFYYITGRLKRFIKIYGNRVNLDESEQIVKTITPACACVGKDDKMIVYVTDKTICSQVRTLLSEKTGLNNLAFEVRYIAEIPKNSSGKVQYTELNYE